MNRLFRGERSTRSVTLPLPVRPHEADATGAWAVHDQQEGVAWAQNVEFGSRVHLELRVTVEGHVYVESVRVSDVLDHEEPADHPGPGGETSQTPTGDTATPVDVVPDRTNPLSDPRDGESSDDGDENVLPHDPHATGWDTAIATMFAQPTHLRLELRTAAV